MVDTNFGALFAQYDAVYQTVGGLFAEDPGPIDLDAAARYLRKHHPQLDLPSSELREAIWHAAGAAGIPVKADGAECA